MIVVVGEVMVDFWELTAIKKISLLTARKGKAPNLKFFSGSAPVGRIVGQSVCHNFHTSMLLPEDLF